jgi:purine-nucleoside phosphorylase
MAAPATLTSSALAAAAARLRPEVAVVLGSGLSPIARRSRLVESFPFSEIPGLATPTVDHHPGKLSLGSWAGRRVLVFEGRLHYYEGHPWRRVEAPVRIAAELGARLLLLTNAAGGIRDDLSPGSLMAIRDHIEWNRPYCWRTEAEQTSPYSPALVRLLIEAGRECDVTVSEGVYAAVTGPNYETPAEIRALRAWGADAVGMSTTREALQAAELGLACAALSCITNRAAGLSGGPINHQEVVTTAAAQAERLGDLIEAFLSHV